MQKILFTLYLIQDIFFFEMKIECRMQIKFKHDYKDGFGT